MPGIRPRPTAWKRHRPPGAMTSGSMSKTATANTCAPQEFLYRSAWGAEIGLIFGRLSRLHPPQFRRMCGEHRDWMRGANRAMCVVGATNRPPRGRPDMRSEIDLIAARYAGERS